MIIRSLVTSVFVLYLGCNGKGGQNRSLGEPFTWEWILDTNALSSPPPEVDYFGIEGLDSPASYISEVRANGTTPWCYLSVGTAENWRDDYDAFLELDAADRADGQPGLVGDVYPEWPDERWLNVRRYTHFLHLMEARLDICADKGFVWVEFDNMDAHEAQTGFDISSTEQLSYVSALIDAANARGLGTIHKNATDLAPDLASRMEGMLLESCVLYDFCEEAAPYLEADKPVMDAEYPAEFPGEGVSFDENEVCTAAARAGVNTLLKTLDLDDQTTRCTDVVD